MCTCPRGILASTSCSSTRRSARSPTGTRRHVPSPNGRPSAHAPGSCARPTRVCARGSIRALPAEGRIRLRGSMMAGRRRRARRRVARPGPVLRALRGRAPRHRPQRRPSDSSFTLPRPSWRAQRSETTRSAEASSSRSKTWCANGIRSSSERSACSTNGSRSLNLRSASSKQVKTRLRGGSTTCNVPGRRTLRSSRAASSRRSRGRDVSTWAAQRPVQPRAASPGLEAHGESW
mmetsp:Transcript_17946/g.60103  ORF Transcript_17946/g.60103 Transcript_17946/m.60103 type:complete len:234 (+) Transcript_17946:321-1022(+)